MTIRIKELKEQLQVIYNAYIIKFSYSIFFTPCSVSWNNFGQQVFEMQSMIISPWSSYTILSAVLSLKIQAVILKSIFFLSPIVVTKWQTSNRNMLSCSSGIQLPINWGKLECQCSSSNWLCYFLCLSIAELEQFKVSLVIILTSLSDIQIAMMHQFTFLLKYIF